MSESWLTTESRNCGLQRLSHTVHKRNDPQAGPAMPAVGMSWSLCPLHVSRAGVRQPGPQAAALRHLTGSPPYPRPAGTLGCAGFTRPAQATGKPAHSQDLWP